MKAHLNHIQVNVDVANLPFYKELMLLLGFDVLHEGAEIIGFTGKEKASIWFSKFQKENKNDYDAIGMNHIGIGVDSVSEVDEAVSFLKEKGIETLFDTPRHRTEFGGEKGTYYQVMFESPDKILFEVMYYTAG